jgi:hypothetical protein
MILAPFLPVEALWKKLITVKMASSIENNV